MTGKEKTMLCVEDFSDYLRANLDIMSSDRLIPFEDELSHIKAYASLALADKEKNIRIHYDIREEHFRLPPLTVEPLVENAIRHGVFAGGTVTVSSYTEGEDYVVTVEDDGVGFAGSDAKETLPPSSSATKRTGIGIENARTLLASLCGGTLTIESGKGGTLVTVRIPRNCHK